MKTYHILIASCLLLLFAGSSPAQEITNADVQQVSPLTPNAAAFGRYGNVPVSLYTGIPNIQIPIYEIKVRDFSLPVSLSYHASGVKVEDVPSWVGMGWSLNAGGAINRQVRGILDERMIRLKHSFNDEIQTIHDPNATSVEKSSAAYTMADSKFDTESDIFSISAGRLSQKFFLDTTGNAYCFPANKLKIMHEDLIDFNDNGIENQFARWIVTDTEGVKYIFGRTLDDSSTDVEIYTMQTSCGSTTSGDPQYVSSWYLNKVILPTGDSIDFKYETYSFCIQKNIQGLHAAGNGGPYEKNTISAINYIQAVRIKEILFPSGKISFIAGEERKDISGAHVLDEIEIYALKSGVYDLVKSFKLTTNNPNATSGDDRFRLALLSIREMSASGEQLPATVFEYDHQNTSITNFGLPSKDSFAQDIWGYYNGKSTNTSLIPTYSMRDENGFLIHYIERADRSVSTLHAEYGILKKITYPTGGSSEFYYESNIARGATDPSDPDSENPLIRLAEMQILDFSGQTLSFQLDNTNGSDVGYSTPFEIVDAEGLGVDVQVDARILYIDTNNPCTVQDPPATGYEFDCLKISLERENESGTFVSYNSDVYFDRSYPLGAGVYRVKLEWSDNSQIGSLGYVDLSWTDDPPPPDIDVTTEMKVGGLRIAKIVDYDPVNDQRQVRRFNYDFDHNDPQIRGTSGTIMNAPLNYYKMGTYYYVNGSGITQTILDAHIVTSYTSADILQTNGGYVGYKKVTVDYGENSEGGRTSTYFLSAEDHIDGNIVNSQEYPFPPTVSYDWRRGLVEKEITSKGASAQYAPVQTAVNNYQFNDSPAHLNHKLYEQIKIVPVYNSSGLYFAISNVYGTVSESFYQANSTRTEHTSKGDFTTISTFVQDDKSLRTSSFTIEDSFGKITETKYKYPHDYDDGVEHIATLKSNNIIGIPIKVETSVNGNQTKGIVTKFNDFGKPAEVYSYENKSLTAAASHDSSLIVPQNYDLKTSYIYDNTSKLLVETIPNNDKKSSYIWSLNNTYPVIIAENIDEAVLQSAANSAVAALAGSYSGLNDLMDALVGKMHGGAGNLRSVWQDFNTNLRNSLGNALITTYTYDPLVGMTSQTDPNGITSYYEYDEFDRLKLIKDENDNIVQHYEYHYKEQ